MGVESQRALRAAADRSIGACCGASVRAALMECAELFPPLRYCFQHFRALLEFMIFASLPIPASLYRHAHRDACKLRHLAIKTTSFQLNAEE